MAKKNSQTTTTKTVKEKSIQEQIRESVVNSQLRQAMINNGQDPDAFKKLQQEYDRWNAIQDLQKEYDAWNNKQSSKNKQSSAGKLIVENKPFMTAEERKAYKEQTTVKDPLGVIDPEKTYAATYGEKHREGRLRKKEIAARNEARAIMRGETPESQTVNNQQPFVDRTLRGDMLDEYTNALVAKAEKAARDKEASMKALENQFYPEEKKQDIGLSLYGNNTVDGLSMPQYQPRKTVQEETAPDTRTTQEKIADWLSPDYVLSEAEKEEARQIAQAELEKYNYRSGHIPVIQSNEDRVNYANMVNLLNKTSKVANTMQGFLDPYYNLARYASDAVNAVRQKIAPNEEAQATKDYVDNAYNLARQNAKVQDPNLYAGGQLAGNLSAYALTNPVFDAAGALAGANAAGRFALNQVGQAGQDVALDIIPTYREMMEDGVLSEAEKGELIKRFGADVVANLAMGSIPYLGSANYDYLAKTVGNNADIFKNMDATGAIRNAPDLIRETADAVREAEQLRQPIPSMNTAEDITNDINRQFTDAMRRYNSEAPGMRNIYSADDLESSLSDQLKKAIKDNEENFVPTKYLYSDGTKQYPDERIKILNRDKNNVINTGSNIDEFINVAKKDKRYNAKFHYALASDELAKDIKSGTGRDLSNYSIVLSGDRVRHDLKQHGKTSEALRGQEVIEPENMKDFIKAFNNPDSVENVMELDSNGVLKQAFDNENRPLIKFTKRVNGKSHVVIGVSDGKKNLYVDTYYMTKSKKNPSTTVNDITNNIPSSTSKTFRGTDSLDSNVANNTPKVNENTVNTFEIPSDTFNKIDSEAIELARPINEVQRSGIMDSVTDEKALLEWAKLNEAYSDYVMKAQFGDSVEEVEAAKKVLDNTRKRYARAMQNIDPEVSKSFNSGSYGNTIGRPLHERNKLIKSQRDAEDTANLILQNEAELNGQQPTRNLQIRNTNGKTPKYYVVEVEGNLETPVESGKLYKTEKEANEAIYRLKNSKVEGENPLQFFAEGDSPKEEWKTSKWRTNTAEKTGAIQNPDDIPLKDYGYRVFHEIEQKEASKIRYADSKDVAADLLHTTQFDEVDMKAAMDEWLDLMNNGSTESLRKARRLGAKISHEGREGARIVQALAEYGRSTPEGQLRFAQDAINDIVDKKVGTGTSDALDNITEKIYKAFDNANGDKDAFAKEVDKILDGTLRGHANADTAKKMSSKAIRGKDKILKMIEKGASIDDIVDQVYKQNGGVKLTLDEEKKIYDYLVAAQKETEGSYAQEVLLSKAAKLAVGRAPSTLGQKIRSVLYTNMLGNFKTALSRNAFGNLAHQTLEQGRQPIAAAVDWATSKVTGKHSALGWNAGKAKAYAQGFAQGTVEQVKDIAKHVDTGRSGAKGWEEALRNNATTFNDSKLSGKLANSVEFYVRNAMELGDRPFYEANYRQAYTELEQLLDRYGKDGVAGLEGIEDKDLPEMMDMIASVRAADAVFQKHGKMSKGLTDIRNGLGQMSEGVVGADVLSTAASPFTMTPGNMIEKAIEYTPLGFLKNGVETAREVLGKQGFNQRRFVDEASRSIMGLPVLGAAYYGAKNGLINGGYSTDPDEKQAQIDDGFIEYGLNVPEWVPYYGGKTLDTSDLPEYGPFMQAGAVMAEEGISPGSSLQAAEAILGGSTTQGLRRVFGADNAGYSSNDSVMNNIANTVLSSGSQLIPSLARQTAQTMDTYKRDLGEYGTTEYYLNLMKNSDPIGRQTLPIKTDVEGNPILQNQGRSLPEKILENYFLPMNVSEYRPSELNQEASRLLEETGSAKGFQPKALRKDLRAWDEKAEQDYSEEQFRDYKEAFGKMNAEVGTAVINSDLYKGLDAEAQNKMLSDVYSAMKDVARYNMTGIETDDKIAKAYMDGDVTGMLRYLTTKSIADQYGVGSTSKVYQSIQAAVGRNDVAGAKRIAEKEAKYHEALDSLGLEGSTAARKAYDEGGTNGLKKFAQYKATLEKYGLENNADNRKFLDEYGEKGLKEKQIFDSYGSNAKDAYTRYNNAKTVIPGLSASQFKSTYDSIDKMEKTDGYVSQKEMLSYLNSGNYSQEQANQLWEAYGNEWKKSVAKNKKGQWAATK